MKNNHCLLATIFAALLSIAAPAMSVAATSAPSMRLEKGATLRVSDHVHVISSKGRSGVPNVGIIIGQRATLIVDTGLGTPNGQLVLREMQRLSKTDRVYLTATHYHPEHIGGENAFPAQSRVIRARAQQDDVESVGMSMIERFRGMSADNGVLLEGFAFRAPDILFERELTIDLGGVTVRMLAPGPAHTNGDTLMLVPEDGVLFTGDIVQKRLTPAMTGDRSTAQSWLGILDSVDQLNARVIVPSHGELTDAGAIGENREVLKFLQARALTLKKSGITVQAASDTLVQEFQAKFPGWRNENAIRVSMPRLYVEE